MVLRLIFILILCSNFAVAGKDGDLVKLQFENFVKYMKLIKAAEEGEKVSRKEATKNKELSKKAISIVNVRIISRRALGPKVWRKIGAKEQNNFVSTMRRLIVLNAFPRSSRFMKKVTYTLKPVSIAKGVATLRQIVTIKGDDENPEDTEMLVDYFFEKSAGKWRMADLGFDGITPLVSTYRNQFASLIRKKKYSGLIGLMMKKKRELEKEYGSVIPK